MSIFTVIKQAISANLREKRFGRVSEMENPVLEWHTYPMYVIQWFVNQGAFTVSVKITGKYSKKLYTVELQNINLESPALSSIERFNTPINRLQAYYDKVRPDMNRCFSTPNIAGYDAYYNKNKYEKLALTDSATFDLFCQSIGFKTPQEYLAYTEQNNISEEEIEDRFRTFMDENLAADYEYSFNEELELLPYVQVCVYLMY